MNKKKLLIIIGSIITVALVAIVLFIVTNNKKPITYEVSFETNGGSLISIQTVKDGEKVKKPEDPIKDGYIFDEWTEQGKSYDFNQEVKSNIVLTAKWVKLKEDVETYIVKFNSDGGSIISNQFIEKGNKVEKPTDPTKEGYIFVEWQLSNSKYDFEAEVTGNIELIAKWEENKATNDEPIINNQGNSNVENNNSGNSNTEIKNQGNNNSGNSNTGNNNQENNNSGNNNPGTTTPVVNKYTVTFNSNGGSAVASQTITEGGKATKPSNPTRSGYTFIEWTLNGSAYNFGAAVNGNITLVATWKENVKNKYTVTFNSNGGSAVASQTITEGSKVTKPSNPTRSGYTFAGWTLNGSNYDFNSAVTGNITLVAKWTQKTYTIKASMVDTYSPDRILKVYEDGKEITVQSIKYSNGAILCSGSNTTVYYGDIEGITSYIVVLSDGIQVKATLN